MTSLRNGNDVDMPGNPQGGTSKYHVSFVLYAWEYGGAMYPLLYMIWNL